MRDEPRFISGLLVKEPHERAPEYVKARLSIKREELIAWLSAQDGEWINADIKEARTGKWYVAVDDWKPERGGGHGGSRGGAPQRSRQPVANPAPADDFGDDDIPFITNRSAW